MTGIVRQQNELRALDLRTPPASRTADSASMVIVVRKVIRDPQGFIGRVTGHVLIEAGLNAKHVSLSLVGVDQSGTTTVVERCGRIELESLHDGRRAERLEFAIDVRRRLTPAFETPWGERWWELRATVRGVRPQHLDHLQPLPAVRQLVDMPAVRRSVRVLGPPAPPNDAPNWIRWIPPSLRPRGYAFDPASNATGRACVRSRGDWGIVDVPDADGQHWCASILQYEQLDDGVLVAGLAGRRRFETVYSRPLVGGPNTLEFVLPAGAAPSHTGPLLTTWYEFRVHTADGRRLGARHRVDVLY